MTDYHESCLKTDSQFCLTISKPEMYACQIMVSTLSYYTLPMIAFTLYQSLLFMLVKLTGVEIELVYDQHMYDMIET